MMVMLKSAMWGGRREIGQPLEMSLEGDEGFGKRHWIFGHVELIFCWSKIRCFTRWLFYECHPYSSKLIPP